MIRQYRHATRQYLWELVAGRRAGGDAEARGERELLEETDTGPNGFKVFLDVSLPRAFWRNGCNYAMPRG